jgi:hypothetical protein
MYLLLGLFYVILVVYEALRGPLVEVEKPQKGAELPD